MADSSQYNLSLVITANNKAVWELNKIGDSVEKVKWNVTKLSQTTEQTLKTIWASATVVAWTMAYLWKTFLDSAIQNEPLQRSYERLSASANICADEMLEAMRKASRWTVDDTTLMAQANKAYSLGIVKNVDDMSTIMEIARVKGQAMWRTMNEALDDIVTGLWRGSAQILDNLWIVVKQSEAQEMYAKQIWKTVEQLTEEEKKQALVNAVVSQWKKELEDAWEVELTLAERLQVVNAQRENTKNTIWDALMPILQKVLTYITPIIQKIGDRIKENPKLTANIMLVVTAVSWLVAVLSWLWLILPAITTAIWVLTWPIWIVIWAITALWIARANDRWGIQEKTDAVVQKISDIIWPRLEKMKTRRAENGEKVMNVLSWVWDAIENIFSAALEIIWASIEVFFQWIDVLMNIFSWNREEAREWIKNIVATVRETIKNVIQTLFWWAIDRVSEKLSAFWNWISDCWESIKETVCSIASSMRETIKEWFSFYIALFTGDRETLYNISESRANSLDNILTSIFWETRENIKVWVQEFYDFVVWIFDKIKEKITGVVDWIKNAWSSVKDWASNMLSSARDFVSSPFKAWWGDVYSWQPYIVWEHWPELFVPSERWSITPTNQITNNNWIEINMSWITVRSEADIQAIAEEITRRIKLEKNYWII